MTTPTCYEAIGELDVAIRELIGSERQYFVLGGIATAAINHPESVFDHMTDTLVAGFDSGESVIRENGTRRDIDLLILDRLTSEEATKISDGVAESIRQTLEVSVFGLKARTEASPKERIRSLARVWTSDRTVDEQGRMYYELFPLFKEVPIESYEPWQLEMPNNLGRLAILNPAAHTLAYQLRSSSGVRSKDLEKVEKMKRVIESSPEFMDQINDGVLLPWAEFAKEIQNFVWGNKARPAGIDLSISQAELAWLRQKGHMLKFFESNPTIVKYAQTGFLQKVLKPLVGAS